MNRPPPTARRLAESYSADLRASLTVTPEAADDPVAIAAAAAGLPDEPRSLLETLWLAAVPGDPLPDRFRPQIEKEGGPLWRALVLLPRATPQPGADIHPLHYAGSCRLNPALKGWRPPVPTREEATPAFPPSDARWDAVVVAAELESQPGQLTMEGVLRRDVEKRMLGRLGGDPDRWTLALQTARLTGLVRPAEGRLRGFPEAIPRALADPAALFADPVHTGAAAMVLRVVGEAWIDVPAWLEQLRTRGRTVLYSPPYSDRSDVPFDDAGWATVERAILHEVLDTLHRAGVLDAARTGADIVAVRRAAPRPGFQPGFLLTPDNDILVHAGELSSTEYGRLARLAPYVDGERVHRHRLTREGVAADLAAGNRDTHEFLASHSRTGLPPNTADSVREWQRSATRITVLSGVDVIEDDDGTLRIATGPVEGAPRVIDYAKAPPARFLYRRGRITIPDASDTLAVRAAVEQVARFEGREDDERIYVPERRRHASPERLLARLREHYGGELPGEIEVLVLSGSGIGAVTCAPAFVVRLPPGAADALRRDWIAGPLLKRAVTAEEILVLPHDLATLKRRLAELGVELREG
ncbi:MAG: hypothetical protein ACOZNI_32610 [Myxococcota bacterium]